MKTETLEQRLAWLKPQICYGIIWLLIFFSATMVVFQVYEYRRDYRDWTAQLRERDSLNAEWGRLQIEQQTFGATAQVATRAVTQLRMYSPPAEQIVVISLPVTSEDSK